MASTEEVGVNLPLDEGLSEQVSSMEGQTWSWEVELLKGMLGRSVAVIALLLCNV